MSNDILDLIKYRRSVKNYNGKEIEESLLDKILEAGMYAPTGKNMMAPIIIAVTNKEIRDKLSKLNSKILGVDIDPFYNAPVVVCVLFDKSKPTGIYDASCVMENMMLEATSLGVCSCWIHRAKEMFETIEGKEILQTLGVSGEYEGCGNLILGYSDKEYPTARPRKDNYIYKIK